MRISCRYNCICPPGTQRKCTDRRDIPGSTAFVPAAAGLAIASYVARDIGEFDIDNRKVSSWVEKYQEDNKDES